MNDLPVVRSPWRILILVLGFTFLYAPMLMLVIYSFNSSKLVTVWAGWSTRWYSELFHDDAMMSAVGLSLTIAACAATAAAILGTIAAVVMVRFGRFRGSNGFAFMITAPMIMPAVISGWLLAFTLSLDDLVIASFVSGPGATTLPMLVFSSVRMGVNPEINALATLILGVVGIVGFIAWYLMARAEKQRVRDIQRARSG